MATKKHLVSSGGPKQALFEYPLGLLGVIGDVPMPRIIEHLRPRILRAILARRHGYPEGTDVEKTMECKYLFIGPSRVQYQDRSRLKVTYRLTTPPLNAQVRPSRNFSRWRNLAAWIGAGSKGGISIYWHKEKWSSPNP